MRSSYEPKPGNDLGVLAGGSASALKGAVRGRAWPELGAQVDVPEILDDSAPVNLSGLSCRWAPLQSQRGKVPTLVIHVADDPGAAFA